MAILTKLYEWLIRCGNSLQPGFLLIVRVYWGWQFAETGWGKLSHIEKVIQFFGSLGIPAPVLNAWFVSGLEFCGGILLIVGLGSRLIGVLLMIDMIVAYVAADREALSQVIADPGKFYGATPYTFLFASLIVLIFGPGKYSLDAWLARRFAAKPEAGRRSG